MTVDAVLFAAMALMLGGAKLCADLFERAGLPSVLGELACGVVIGNLGHLGWHGLDFVAHDPQLGLLAELGVLVLMFQVGLESDRASMRRVGAVAFAVATVGVVVPMGLGYGLDVLLAPARSWQAHLFLGAVLAATSVGITARVLKDLGHVDSPTGRVVLGAAVIDDVLGLIVLAVVVGVVRGADTGEHLAVGGVVRIVAFAIGFLGVALALGPAVSRRLYRAAAILRVRGVLLAASLAFCLAIAWLAHVVGLAPLVGAFAAGLVLDDLVVRDLASREELPLETQLKPIGELLTPIFFAVTGAQVDLAAFGDPTTLAWTGALTLAAVLGKQACALAAFGPGVHRRSVGVGMIPRGEVGLIFAAAGAQLAIGGVPVVTHETYAAIVGMVIVTTLMTPPLLAWSLRGART